MNPARKTRPQAPRLPEFSFEKRLRAESRSPGPSPRSGTDTEESAPPSGGAHCNDDLQKFKPTTRLEKAEIRQRGVPMRPMPMGTPHAMVMTPTPGARPLLGPAGTPVERVPLSAPGGPPDRSALSASVLQGAVPRTPSSPMQGMHPPGPPLARPILPKDRGALDRVIEYLVGDGPQNRYALICQQCFSHNGMALKEEFEYLGKLRNALLHF
uniref:Endoplasmic reticulum junction formation protein lunapark n=2 Tax=Oreochromis aureus TaxID=47969 RepID=A0AAZ1XIN3_OREAU